MRGPVWMPLSVGVLLGLLVGCASVDPRGDIALSAQRIKDRTGHTVDWSRPAASGPDGIWDGKSPLTAQQAVLLALWNSPTLRVDLAGISTARADLVQAGLLPNPVLSVSLGWGVGSPSSMVTAGGMQSLSSLWLLPSRKTAAQADLQRSVLQVSDNAIALAAQVEKSHRRVVHYQALLPVLEEQSKAVAGAEQASREKLAAGLGTSLDVNRFRTELLEIAAEIRGVQTNIDVEKRRLLELLNRADGPADWSAAAPTLPVGKVPDEQALASLARQQRLDLLAASWSVQAQRARVQEAQLESLPDIDLGADVERETPAGESAMTTAGPAVRMEVPIFDQGRARIAKARAELDRRQMEAQGAEQKAILQVRETRRSLQNAEEQAHAYRTELVPLAAQNVRQAQAAFEAGEVDVLDVLMAERDWARARVTLQQFELERDLARIELSKAVGGRLVLEHAYEP